jgi:hypothetical protein
MSQPPTYSRAFNFGDYQATNPSTPVPGNKLDEEFSRIKAVIDAIRANLALVQRDDTAIANESIGYDQLKAELDGFGFNPPSEWATSTNYVVRDTVFHDSSFYRCLVSHTSGTFATDLAAEKWALIADFTAATSDAETAKTAAETAQAAAEAAQAAAETAETNAAASASAASTSATAAAGSASDASDSADAAAASAATAATLISGTVTEAVRHDVAQGLSSGAQDQARANISALKRDGSDVSSAATFRANIGLSYADAAAQKALLANIGIDTSGAEGDIFYRDANGLLVKLPKGTAGQFLCQNAGLTAPEWATGWERLSAASYAGSSAINFTGLSAFRRLTLSGYLQPSVDGAVITVRTSTNNGVTYDAAAGYYDYQTAIGSNATFVGTRTSDSGFVISASGVGNDTGEGLSFDLAMNEFNQARYLRMRATIEFENTSGNIFSGTISGRRLEAVARNGFQVVAGSSATLFGYLELWGSR